MPIVSFLQAHRTPSCKARDSTQAMCRSAKKPVRCISRQACTQTFQCNTSQTRYCDLASAGSSARLRQDPPAEAVHQHGVRTRRGVSLRCQAAEKSGMPGAPRQAAVLTETCVVPRSAETEEALNPWRKPWSQSERQSQRSGLVTSVERLLCVSCAGSCQSPT